MPRRSIRPSFQAPKVRLYSNTSGKAHSSDPEEIRKVLKGHILNPVLFKDEIENIYAEGGYFFLEFGPKNVLTNLVKSILENRPHLAVALNATPKKDSDRLLREAVVQLRVAGLALKPVDPYQVPASTRPARKKSMATVKLNGGDFVSPKTKAAFVNALNDGFRVSSAQPAAPVQAPTPAPTAAPLPVTESQVQPVPLPAALAQSQPSAPAAVYNPAAAQSVGNSLEQLSEHQSEVVRLHEQYLHNQESTAKFTRACQSLRLPW